MENIIKNRNVESEKFMIHFKNEDEYLEYLMKIKISSLHQEKKRTIQSLIMTAIS